MTVYDYNMTVKKSDKSDVNIPLDPNANDRDGASSREGSENFYIAEKVFDDDLGDDLDSEASEEENERGSWNKKAEYLLSAIGYSVGLGNVYRFPYVCIRNGGGAFLIPFFICLMVCGLPLYFLEVSMGQFIGKSSMHAFAISPIFKGAGIAMNVLQIIASWYYAIILGWALVYLAHSFRDPLPWTTCGNWWNSDSCVVSSGQAVISSLSNMTSNGTLSGAIADLAVKSNSTLVNRTTPASEEFWINAVLELPSQFGDLMSLPWHTTLGLFVALLVVLMGIIKGVKSVGKVVYVTATLPYILIGILLIKGATLPGAGDGVLFYVKPDFSKILTVKTWLEASLQVFFSLGPGWGALHTMASYNKFKNNCLRDAVMLSLLCEGSSVFAGFAIFTVLGHMSHTLGVPVANFSRSGAGLAFVVYPEAISYLPLPQLWAVLFFIMLFTVGLDTMFVSVETVLTTVADVWPRFMKRRGVIVKILIMGCFFLASLPFASRGGMYLFQLVDWYCSVITVPLVTLVECVIVGYIYGFERFYRDLELMLGYKAPAVFKPLWAIVNPILLVTLFVSSVVTLTPPILGTYEYTTALQAVGWFIALVSFVPLPLWALYSLIATPGSLTDRLRKNLQPSASWKPSDPGMRTQYLMESKQEKRICAFELPCCSH